jgi:hypothetical protein
LLLETDKIIGSCGASDVNQELPVIRLPFRSAGQVHEKDSVVTYILLLTGNLQFAEKLVAQPEFAAAIKRDLNSGMSARDCAMGIIGTAVTRAIVEIFDARPHQRVFFEKRQFSRADRDSLTTMLHCICDRMERWRRSSRLEGESANQLCKQVFDALRSKSERWTKANAQASDIRFAA